MESIEIEKPTSREVPENGLKGLKHWRQDMFAGFVIALVSVPLSLGILWLPVRLPYVVSPLRLLLV